MSGKLDQSLDQILADRRANGTAGRGRGRGRGGPRPASTRNAAPTGGVQKKTKAVAKPAPTKGKPNGTAPVQAAVAGNDSKIIVSNLPKDVDEQQIQDYFKQSVGPVKRVHLEYNKNGQSTGRATILFTKAGGAQRALDVNNGVLVEGRPMKIEIIVDPTRAAAAPQKTLSDRITAPKNAVAQPKTAGPKKDKAAKAAANGTATAERGAKTAGARGRGAKRGRAAGRPKKKTAEELDAEMTDYFVAGNEDAPNGATAPAAVDADTGMDEVS